MGETSHRSLIKGSRLCQASAPTTLTEYCFRKSTFKIKHTKPKYFFKKTFCGHICQLIDQVVIGKNFVFTSVIFDDVKWRLA